MIRAFQATPTVPSPLLPAAATMPETWLPCPLSSRMSPVSLDEVPAVDVVDEAVAVVVDPVARDLAGVDPQLARQVGMGRVDAGVEHRHDRPGAGGDVPGLGGVDVDVVGVVQAPLLASDGSLEKTSADRNAASGSA